MIHGNVKGEFYVHDLCYMDLGMGMGMGIGCQCMSTSQTGQA